jgi:hypothetical protein
MRLFDALAEVWLVALAVAVLVVALVGLRRFGLAAGLLAASLFALAVYKRLVTQPMPDVDVVRENRPAAPSSGVAGVPLAAVEAQDLAISGSGAPYTISGQVANRSTDYALNSITLRIRRLDCHGDALAQSGCDVLWERDKWIDLAVAPGESRRFSVSDWAMDATTRPRGVVRDDIAVVKASGHRVSATDAH